MADRKIRVLLVDDSQAYRLLLRREFEGDARFEVVSHAVNGRLALPRVRHYRPDFVILDQEMPEMDGLDTLRAIRDNWPEVGVLMFSSHTVEGARTTLRALELGALDFVAKPTAGTDVASYLRANLLAKVAELAALRSQRSVNAAAASLFPQTDIAAPCEACAIGVSTGGPVALRELLEPLPPDLSGPILIVQHMPPLFTKQMSEYLNSICAVTVCEAEHGQPVSPGVVYVAPGGRHMRVRNAEGCVRIEIGDEAPELNCRPSVNILFRSVAEAYGGRAMALIMTGMGEDGYEGIRALRATGGRIFAQSEESCVVYGMPARPARERLVEGSYDIAGLVDVVTRRLGKAAAVGR